VSSPLKAIPTFPDDALLQGDVMSVDDHVALTSLEVSALQQQGFRLGEPLTVHIDGQPRVACYVGTLLPSVIDTLFGPDNLEDAEVAVATAFDNRQRLTAVELIALDGRPLPVMPFAITRGEIEVPIDGMTLAETAAAAPNTDHPDNPFVEVTVAAVGCAALAVRCDVGALDAIGVGPLHRLTFQVDGRMRRVLQDRPENQDNLAEAWEQVMARLPGGARLMRERARLKASIANAAANGQPHGDLEGELRALDDKLEGITVPPVRAAEIPLVARRRAHWDDPSESVLVLRPMVGELLSFVVESGQTIRLRRG
jgi:hypothetical protein